jgi:hypothetical protein
VSLRAIKTLETLHIVSVTRVSVHPISLLRLPKAASAAFGYPIRHPDRPQLAVSSHWPVDRERFALPHCAVIGHALLGSALRISQLSLLVRGIHA